MEKYKTSVLTEIPATELDNILAWIKPPTTSDAPKGNKISKEASKKLDDMAHKTGWQPLEWVAFLTKKFNVSSSADLTAEQYEQAFKAANGEAV